MGSLWFDVGISGGNKCGEKRWWIRESYNYGEGDVEGNAVVDAEVMVGKTMVYMVAKWALPGKAMGCSTNFWKQRKPD